MTSLCKSSGGLYKLGTSTLADFAGSNNLILGQVGVFENDFKDDFGIFSLAQCDDLAEFLFNLIVRTRFEMANVEHHIKFNGSIFYSLQGLGNLCTGGRIAMGE